MSEKTRAPTPLEDLRSVADEIAEKWDVGMKAGKLLAALEGRIANYDPRVTRIIRALADTLPEARQPETGWRVPDGWKLVPVEPTREMKQAAFGPIMEGGRGGPMTADWIRQEAALDTYRKIIAATPPAPPLGSQGGEP